MNAKVKLILWPRMNQDGSINSDGTMNEDGTYPIRIRITKGKKVSYSATGYSVKKDQWDLSEQLVKKHPNKGKVNHALIKLKAEAMDQAVSQEMKNPQTVPADVTAKLKKDRTSTTNFNSFAVNFYDRYNNDNSRHTYEKYVQITAKLKEYGGDRPFSSMDYRFFDGFLSHLQSEEKAPGTIHNYFAKIKAIWKVAMNSGETDRITYPFTNLNLPKITKGGKKEKLTVDELATLRKTLFTTGTNLYYARLSFLFSYNCMGIRAGDLVKLKVSDIKNRRLEYKMHKSHDNMSIYLTDEAFEIYNTLKVGKKPEEYLFPWYDKTRLKEHEWRRKNVAVNLYNKYLKIVAKDWCKIDKSITTHVARHTWAYHAKLKLVDIGLIQQALGHEDQATTKSYLESFPDAMMDEANRKVTEIELIRARINLSNFIKSIDEVNNKRAKG